AARRSSPRSAVIQANVSRRVTRPNRSPAWTRFPRESASGHRPAHAVGPGLGEAVQDRAPYEEVPHLPAHGNPFFADRDGLIELPRPQQFRARVGHADAHGRRVRGERPASNMAREPSATPLRLPRTNAAKSNTPQAHPAWFTSPAASRCQAPA